MHFKSFLLKEVGLSGIYKYWAFLESIYPSKTFAREFFSFALCPITCSLLLILICKCMVWGAYTRPDLNIFYKFTFTPKVLFAWFTDCCNSVFLQEEKILVKLLTIRVRCNRKKPDGRGDTTGKKTLLFQTLSRLYQPPLKWITIAWCDPITEKADRPMSNLDQLTN